MIHEKIRITVFLKKTGKRFQKIVDICSDGSYHMVDELIVKTVESAFNATVGIDCQVSWSYV